MGEIQKYIDIKFSKVVLGKLKCPVSRNKFDIALIFALKLTYFNENMYNFKETFSSSTFSGMIFSGIHRYQKSSKVFNTCKQICISKVLIGKLKCLISINMFGIDLILTLKFLHFNKNICYLSGIIYSLIKL